MRQSSTTISAAQKNILAYAQHFLSINIKCTKANVTAKLVNGILPAGKLIAANGNVATTTSTATDAIGVLLEDVDFNNSQGTEVLPVVIHGFIKTADVAFDATYSAVEKAALNMIKFL